ncbi:NAD-dependent epimerase/dehydratase family protein [Poseidonibacter ostreae]|uniref:NAD-dependent epimerase/dehydratase family protein n=1 Tax=Poseidonibacter ostreae TaxID=2654171 RepID=A0A6L4WTW7_9BACT|nr:NAD-dependent epimerase/dehydratase family protein [Poseidonibacter ostreae]KAB7889785.1 NAD-dependent epimerase/dehydratase family protein [Poseidonibacter ostreae]
MKILVTGSSGYLGSSFVDKYKDKYKFEKFSLLTQKLKDINFDCVDIVLHCAALVHQKVEHSYEKYHEINVEYPLELAKLAKQGGVKQFVFISTIAVYGEDEEKLDENIICNPITPYGKSKLEAEKELLQLNDDNFIVSIVRPPMIYGKEAPGNIDSLVKMVKKMSIIPLGGIENQRSFISIQNLCHLIDIMIEKQKSGVFLASDDESLSTTKLCELIAKNLDKKVYLVKIPFFETLLKIAKPSFHKRLYGSLEVDNSITKEKLNLKNPYSVEEGIRFMINGE